MSLLTQDIPRAKRFYADTLGLEIETEGPDDMEFRAGQVTLDIFNPASQGQPFAPSLGGLALRYPTWPRRAPCWRRRGSSSRARLSTRVSATWRSSETLTGIC